MNNIEKIAKIKQDRKQLLQIAKENLTKNGISYQNGTQELLKTLFIDEENTKKYEALVNAQELVLALSEEILDAKTPEDIIAIRKKLNYYINKIKTELKRRNIPEEELLKYQENSSHLRKDISTLLRYTKRNAKLEEIELINQENNLPKEDKKHLTKLIYLEKRYNKRNLEPKPLKTRTPKVEEVNNQNPVVEPVIEQTTIEQPIIDESIIVEQPTNTETKTEQPATTRSFFSLNIPEYVKGEDYIDNSSTIEETRNFIQNRINEYNGKYCLTRIEDYHHGFNIKNLKIFFNNIPKNIYNTKMIKEMQRDLVLYYGGEDLKSFTVYNQRRNSFFQNFKGLLGITHLAKNEDKYLAKHEECVDWIISYSEKNDLMISGRKMGLR